MGANTIARSRDPHRVAGEPPRGGGFRPDLEGVRAVAVVLVLLDHIFHWPRGGFIGVDVFFVLSGFLITGLLLKEYQQTGTISFKGFYVRRIKRILPASTLVILVSAVGVYAVFIGARVQQALADGTWSLLFAANWRFVLVGQDYFAQDRSASPYQHYWSLAVEEQFYFVWPFLLFVCLVGAARAFGRGRELPTIGVVLGLVTAASFAWALLETSSSPLAAYFSTFSRAWELGAGGLLAVAVHAGQRRTPAPLLLSFIGLAGIVASAVILNPGWAFPGPWGVLPVLATLILIYSGVGGTRLNPALTNPATRYVGRISFSLYLWHWPVVVIGQAVLEGTTFYVMALAATVLLSVASFHLVEDPIRHSSWLAKPQVPKGSEARRERLIQRWQTAGLIALMIVTAFCVRQATLYEPPPVASPTTMTSENIVADDPAAANETLQRAIQIAVEAREWPDFTIDLDELEDAKVAEWAKDGCIDVDAQDLERCTYDGGNKLAVVIGDSVAVSWLPTIRGALANEGYATLPLTMGQCPAAHASVRSNDDLEGFAGWCSDYHEFTRTTLAALQPDLVFASSAENSLNRLTSNASGADAEAEWTRATEDMLAALTEDGHQVVLLAPPPQGRNLQGCITRFNSPQDCTSEVGDLWKIQTTAELAALSSLPDSHAVTHLDSARWFCSARGECPAYVDAIPVRADGNHLTHAYATHLAMHLHEELEDLEILPSIGE